MDAGWTAADEALAREALARGLLDAAGLARARHDVAAARAAGRAVGLREWLAAQSHGRPGSGVGLPPPGPGSTAGSGVGAPGSGGGEGPPASRGGLLAQALGPRLAAGQVLAGCTLERELGRGAMGAVWLARDATGAHVAVKALLASEPTPARRERLRREAEVAAGLDHPGIVRVRGHDVDGAVPCLVMDYVAGRDLAQVLAEDDLPLARRLALLEQVARAVGFAHAARVVHRDLKPANVLVDADGEARVADFGLARELDRTTRLTRTGAEVGTPAYMAPEQVRGERDAGPPADVHALGVMLFQAATGRLPWDASTPMALYDQIVRAAPPRPSRVAPGVPPALDAIVARALEKDPAARYPTAHELALDLARLRRGDRVAGRGRAGLAAAGLAAAALLVGAAGALARRGAGGPPAPPGADDATSGGADAHAAGPRPGGAPAPVERAPGGVAAGAASAPAPEDATEAAAREALAALEAAASAGPLEAVDAALARARPLALERPALAGRAAAAAEYAGHVRAARAALARFDAYGRADLEAAPGWLAAARDACARALAAWPGAAEPRLLRARAEDLDHELDAAEALLAELLDAGAPPLDPALGAEAWLRRGLLRAARLADASRPGESLDLEPAYAAFDAAERLAPADPRIPLTRGRTTIGPPEPRHLRDLARAGELDPDGWHGTFARVLDRSYQLAALGGLEAPDAASQLAEVLALCDLAVERAPPGDAKGLDLRAYVLREAAARGLGGPDAAARAEADGRRAIEVHLRFAGPLGWRLHRAWALRRQVENEGRRDLGPRASSILIRVMAERPDDPIAKGELAILHFVGLTTAEGAARQHHERTAAHFEHALELGPCWWELHFYRGHLLRQGPLADPVLALASFDRALALKPDHAWSFLGRAMVALALGRREQAIADAARAAELAPVLAPQAEQLAARARGR